MKHRNHIRAGCALAVCAVAGGLWSPIPASAENEVPCLVMSGHAQGERRIDLSKLNRITFGPESMTVSSKDNPQETQELLYSLYHHIEIRNATPDIETGVVLTPAAEGYSMRYLADSHSLKIDAPEDTMFKTGIFDVAGTLILTAEVRGGEVVSLGSLSSGTYIAVATDGVTALNLKFMVK